MTGSPVGRSHALQVMRADPQDEDDPGVAEEEGGGGEDEEEDELPQGVGQAPGIVQPEVCAQHHFRL